MSVEVLPPQDDTAPEAIVLDFPSQRSAGRLDRKTKPDYVKTYTDLAKLAFASGDIEAAEQYRQMADMFRL